MSIGKELKKTVKGLGKVAKAAAPILGFVVGGPAGFAAGAALGMVGKKKKGGGPDENAQQQAEIARQSSAVDEQRRQIASERELSAAKMRKTGIAANRRRVRGGLFGDAQTDQNISPRLG